MAIASLFPSRVIALPARVLRISVGAWGLVYDAAADAARDPSDAMDRIERRGLRVERFLKLEWRRLRKEGRSEIAHLVGRARGTAAVPARWVKQEIVATGTFAEDEVEHQVERVLERLGIPSRERLERLSQEIEGLSAKIDLELLRLDDGERAAV